MFGMQKFIIRDKCWRICSNKNNANRKSVETGISTYQLLITNYQLVITNYHYSVCSFLPTQVFFDVAAMVLYFRTKQIVSNRRRFTGKDKAITTSGLITLPERKLPHYSRC